MLRTILLIMISAVSLRTYCQTDPGWTINPANYGNSMIVVGVVQLDKVESMDANDKIAAFVGNEIRGVANIKYEAALDRYLAFLSVYSNTTGEVISFKAYDASADVVQDIVTTIEFQNNGLVGDGNSPYVWSNVTLNNEADLLDISFLQSNGDVEFSGSDVSVPLIYNTDVTSLVASFSLSDGATASIGSTLQESGVTSNDFTNSLTYTILSEDEQVSKEYTVAVYIKNDTPTDIQLSGNSLDENSATGATIGSLTATDDDQQLTFTLVSGDGDADNGSFEIDGADLKAASVFDFESKNSFSVRIAVTDGASQSYEEAFIISINDVNEAPEAMTLSATSIDENLPVESVVGNLAVTDQDNGDTQTFTLTATGTDNSFFAIQGNQLVLAEVLNYEEQSSYSVEIQAEDAGGLTVVASFTVSAIDQNDAPTAIALDVTSVFENLAFGTVIGNLSVTDEDRPEVHTLALAAGTGDDDNGKVFISDKKLTMKEPLDYEQETQISVRISATDIAGASYEEVIVIDVVDILDSDILLSNTSFAESESSGFVIGEFSVQDQTKSFTYELMSGSNDNASFSIDGAELMLNAMLDFEVKNTFLIKVKATDEAGDDVSGEFSLTLTDANDAPTGITIDNKSVGENMAEGALVGKMGAIDQDATDTYTYKLLTETEAFKVSGNELQTKASLNFESKNSYDVEVEITDQGGETATQSFTIAVTDSNDAPTAIALSPASITENLPFGTEIGALTSADEDAVDTYKYELVTGAGDDHNNLVVISGDKLLVGQPLNFEVLESLSIRVRTTDKAGSAFAQVLTVSVLDVFDSKVLLSKYDFPESLMAEDTIAAFSIENKSGTFTYALETGASDNRHFSIQNNYLKLKSRLDYESQQAYTIKVRATDSRGQEVTQDLELSLTDANDAPTALALDHQSIAENLPEGTLVGKLSATDQDAADSHTYSILSGSESFKINGDELQLAAALNHEMTPTISVEVEVMDAAGEKFSKSFSIIVTDTNDAPTNITLSPASVSENLPYGTVIGKLTTTDEDAVDSYSYELVAGEGDDQNDFVLVSDDKLILQQPMDYESMSSMMVRVQVKDGGDKTFAKSIKINILDVLDSDILLSKSSFAESLMPGDTIGLFSVEDQTQSFNYTFVSGFNDNKLFAVRGNYLTLAEELSFEDRSEYFVDIAAKDNANDEVSSRLTLYLTDVNEAPVDLTLSNYTLNENVVGGGIVGLIHVEDPDHTENFKLSIQEGSANADLFQIDPNGFLWSKAAFNFEKKAAYDLELVVHDKDSLELKKTVSITIIDQNDVPVLNSAIQDMGIFSGRNTLMGIDPNWIRDEDEGDSLVYTVLSSDSTLVDWITIAGNTDIEFRPRNQGGTDISLQLIAQDQSGSIARTYFDVTFLTITALDVKKAIKVYPNPAAEWVSWELDFEPSSVEVYSMEGKLVDSASVTSNRYQVAHLKGIYLLHLSNENQAFKTRLVIE